MGLGSQSWCGCMSPPRQWEGRYTVNLTLNQCMHQLRWPTLHMQERMHVHTTDLLEKSGSIAIRLG